MRNTRVKGHGLVGEGRPLLVSATCTDCENYRRLGLSARDNGYGAEWWRVDNPGGHARCSCGAESEHVQSQGARRRWHAAHKEEVAKW